MISTFLGAQYGCCRYFYSPKPNTGGVFSFSQSQFIFNSKGHTQFCIRFDASRYSNHFISPVGVPNDGTKFHKIHRGLLKWTTRIYLYGSVFDDHIFVGMSSLSAFEKSSLEIGMRGVLFRKTPVRFMSSFRTPPVRRENPRVNRKQCGWRYYLHLHKHYYWHLSWSINIFVLIYCTQDTKWHRLHDIIRCLKGKW